MKRIFILSLLLLFCAVSVSADHRAVIARKNVASGSAWDMEDDFSSDTTADYTSTTANKFSLSGAAAVPTAGYNDAYMGNTANSIGSADQTVQGILMSNGERVGLIGRYDTGADPDTFYFATIRSSSGAAMTLYSVSGTSQSFVANVNFTGGKSISAATGYLCQLILNGTDIDFKIDFSGDGDFNDADESYDAATDATYSSGNYAGMGWDVAGSTGCSVDDLKAKAN